MTGTCDGGSCGVHRPARARPDRLAGASWFGGNFGSGGGTATDTEHFQIIGPSGGVVANVSIVAHSTVNGQGVVTVEFEKNTGTCTPPEG